MACGCIKSGKSKQVNRSINSGVKNTGARRFVPVAKRSNTIRVSGKTYTAKKLG